MNENALIEFLVEAKRSTYAGHGILTKPSRNNSKDLPYERGAFKYLDSYIGDLHFIGEEVVWYEDKPVWGMNYYGTLLSDNIPKEFGEFLKAALRLVSEDAPYRGPHNYREGELEFICTWQGTLEFFNGEEEIRYQGQTIYRLAFHGGKLKLA